MIRTSVKLTAARFSAAPASIPTIEIWDEARSPEAHRRVMACAHLLAAILWRDNLVGWPIAVEATCDAGAALTMETREDTAAERARCLGKMRAAVEIWRRAHDRSYMDPTRADAPNVHYRADGSPVIVTIPAR
jgi:hypothetical protein